MPGVSARGGQAAIPRADAGPEEAGFISSQSPKHKKKSKDKQKKAKAQASALDDALLGPKQSARKPEDRSLEEYEVELKRMEEGASMVRDKDENQKRYDELQQKQIFDKNYKGTATTEMRSVERNNLF